MCRPQDARRAFKALAYKRYQHVPLYLEWAPRGIFSAPPPPRPAAAAAAAAAKGSTTAAAAAAPTAAAAGGKAGGKAAKPAAAEAELLTGLAEAQADEAESSTIYVKNLAWATAEAALRAHFDAAVSAAGARRGCRCCCWPACLRCGPRTAQQLARRNCRGLPKPLCCPPTSLPAHLTPNAHAPPITQAAACAR